RRGDGWSTPRPLGGVNTPGNDNFPFFAGRELHWVTDFNRIVHAPLTETLRDSLPAVAAEGVMPFEYEDTRLYVPVSARGHLDWFILDTGASPTILDTAFASLLGLHGRDTTQRTGSGTGQLTESFGDSITLRIGNVPLAVPTPAIAPINALLARYTGRRAPGIVGSAFFTGGRAVTLDFENRILYTRRTVHPTESFLATSIPISVSGGVPFVQATLRFGSGRPIPARLMVDLGAKANLLLSEPFIKRAGLDAVQASGVPSILGAGVGGETHFAFTRLARLELAGTSAIGADSLVVGLSVGGTTRSTLFDGLLGAEFMRLYRVTFDYANARMLLRPRLPVPPNLEFDLSGMYVTASGDSLRTMTVATVDARSPAALAGVVVGDQLVALNGREVRSMTLSAVRSVLRGPIGGRITLVVVHAGARVERSFDLARRV
ncbi:MAG: aspartyl protease family protein, partial [Gemmatimonadaceae bacterium]